MFSVDSPELPINRQPTRKRGISNVATPVKDVSIVQDIKQTDFGFENKPIQPSFKKLFLKNLEDIVLMLRVDNPERIRMIQVDIPNKNEDPTNGHELLFEYITRFPNLSSIEMNRPQMEELNLPDNRFLPHLTHLKITNSKINIFSDTLLKYDLRKLHLTSAKSATYYNTIFCRVDTNDPSARIYQFLNLEELVITPDWLDTLTYQLFFSPKAAQSGINKDRFFTYVNALECDNRIDLMFSFIKLDRPSYKVIEYAKKTADSLGECMKKDTRDVRQKLKDTIFDARQELEFFYKKNPSSVNYFAQKLTETNKPILSNIHPNQYYPELITHLSQINKQVAQYDKDVRGLRNYSEMSSSETETDTPIKRVRGVIPENEIQRLINIQIRNSPYKIIINTHGGKNGRPFPKNHKFPFASLKFATPDEKVLNVFNYATAASCKGIVAYDVVPIDPERKKIIPYDKLIMTFYIYSDELGLTNEPYESYKRSGVYLCKSEDSSLTPLFTDDEIKTIFNFDENRDEYNLSLQILLKHIEKKLPSLNIKPEECDILINACRNDETCLNPSEFHMKIRSQTHQARRTRKTEEVAKRKATSNKSPSPASALSQTRKKAKQNTPPHLPVEIIPTNAQTADKMEISSSISDSSISDSDSSTLSLSPTTLRRIANLRKTEYSRSAKKRPLHGFTRKKRAQPNPI